MDDRVRRRLEWRRSNATAPRRNRHRERKTGQQPWEKQEFRDMTVAEDWEDPDDAA